MLNEFQWPHLMTSFTDSQSLPVVYTYTINRVTDRKKPAINFHSMVRRYDFIHIFTTTANLQYGGVALKFDSLDEYI